MGRAQRRRMVWRSGRGGIAKLGFFRYTEAMAKAEPKLGEGRAEPCLPGGKTEALGLPWLDKGGSPAALLAFLWGQRMQTELLRARHRGCRQYRNLDLERFWAPKGGKMLGVLVARENKSGERRVLRAFSGQWAGRWRVPGWVDPLFCVAKWKALEARFDPQIKTLTGALTGALADPHLSSENKHHLRQKRRDLSLQLQDAYFDLVEIPAPDGRRYALRTLWPEGRPPTGAGDCCAPKLLAAALLRGWKVESLAEFYWGHSGTPARQSGCFYPPCQEKCGPILEKMWPGPMEALLPPPQFK